MKRKLLIAATAIVLVLGMTGENLEDLSLNSLKETFTKDKTLELNVNKILEQKQETSSSNTETIGIFNNKEDTVENNRGRLILEIK